MKGAFIIILLIAAFGSAAEAAVVSDTNITLSSGGGNADYALTVFQSEASGSTEMLFDVSGSEISFTNTTVDEGSDWYLTSYRDMFTLASIDAGEFPYLVVDTDTGFDHNVLTVGSGDFYLGVATDAEIGRFKPRDVFGWVHLQNDNGTLTMLDNAVAYGEGGIIIGTTQAVPEPNALALLLFAPLSFRLLTKRHRLQIADF